MFPVVSRCVQWFIDVIKGIQMYQGSASQLETPSIRMHVDVSRVFKMFTKGVKICKDITGHL